ncbi:sensor histidine kinase [Pleomorphomonas sp. NRK KF1]|uniref:sensor histidine kinase n=1 Tax=Pleomorphomonas sp. NRK KF1 TaxID=2943000 RepID=UPI0020432534|nr:HWE histidine kinase domain-containing protein [Pleomorphomonas sp. NRK KF1]MCM5552799.1 PAS domain-containing protein [Pleomorphomonas sp. NRK KF1]
MMRNSQEQALQSLIDDLRQRAAEAEETLAAIRDGSVDAVVVGGEGKDEVLVIGDDASAFRNFMEAMEPGAVAVDSAGRLLYSNARFRQIFAEDWDRLKGKLLSEILPGPASQLIGKLINPDSHEAAPVSVSFLEKGVERNYLVSARPVHLGTVRGFAVTFSDLTERVRAEAAERAERIANAIIASANEAVVVCDRTLTVTHANFAAEALSTEKLVGARLDAAIPLKFPDATGILDIGELVETSLAGTPLRSIEAFAPMSPGARDVMVSAAPLNISDDGPEGCVLTLVDLSQRKKDERQMHLLMRELDHRVKNTLALVLSISKRTAASEETLEGFQGSFSGRIEALAATHNLLAGASWESLSLRQIFSAEVSPYTETGGERVNIIGVDLSLYPRAAIALGLIFHELATNATKYGALSGEKGSIVLEIHPKTDAPSVEVTWTEKDGPAVKSFSRKGFGHTVIARSLSYSPHGGTTMEFEPTGVVCRIRIPASDVA